MFHFMENLIYNPQIIDGKSICYYYNYQNQ